MKLIRTLILCALTLLSACAAYDTPAIMAGDGAMGGLVAGGLGAGTGAIIASSISNGDVGQSALLGGAIGMGVGVLATVGYRSLETGVILHRNQSRIDDNSIDIAQNQAEIDAMRKSLEADSQAVVVSESNYSRVYDGPTIGQENR